MSRDRTEDVAHLFGRPKVHAISQIGPASVVTQQTELSVKDFSVSAKAPLSGDGTAASDRGEIWVCCWCPSWKRCGRSGLCQRMGASS